MDTIEIPELTLGKHVKLEEEWWLPVRMVSEQSTFFEDPKSGTTFVDVEKFWELRDKNNRARFIIISSTRSAVQRDSGPCRGVVPYFWKGATDGTARYA